MNFILLVAAIAISILVFTWLLKIVKASITTAITIAVIVLGLQLLFGIGPDQIWQQVNQIFQTIWRVITGTG